MTLKYDANVRSVPRSTPGPRFIAAVGRYDFPLAGEDGEPGEPVCFVEQKRFKFKEDIRFFSTASIPPLATTSRG